MVNGKTCESFIMVLGCGHYVLRNETYIAFKEWPLTLCMTCAVVLPGIEEITQQVDYRINILGYTFPDGMTAEDQQSYRDNASYYDYFEPSDVLDQTYESDTAADSAANTAYKGNDDYDVGLEWEIIEE